MNTYYKRNNRIAFQSIDDKTLLLNTDQGKVHELNATASFLWDQLDQNPNLNQLVDMMAKQYSPADEQQKKQMFQDVSAMINEWKTYHIIEECQR